MPIENIILTVTSSSSMAAVTVQSCDILGLCKWKRRDRIKAGNERIQPKGPKGGGGGADIISHLKDQQFPFDCDAPVPRFNESTVKFCWIFARGGTKVRCVTVGGVSTLNGSSGWQSV